MRRALSAASGTRNNTSPTADAFFDRTASLKDLSSRRKFFSGFIFIPRPVLALIIFSSLRAGTVIHLVSPSTFRISGRARPCAFGKRRSKEQGARSEKRGARSKEQGARRWEMGDGRRELGAPGLIVGAPAFAKATARQGRGSVSAKIGKLTGNLNFRVSGCQSFSIWHLSACIQVTG